MWLKFKNVATAVIETFHLLLLTLLLGQTIHVQQQFNTIVVMASTSATAFADATTTITTTSIYSPAAAIATLTTTTTTTTNSAATVAKTKFTHLTTAVKTRKTEIETDVTVTSSPALALQRLLTPTPLSASSLTAASSSLSLWQSVTNASKLLNFSLPTTVIVEDITDSNEIDTLSDDMETGMDNDNDHSDNDNNDTDADDYSDQGENFLNKDYVMTKHIAFSDDSTRNAETPSMMTTSSIKTAKVTAQQRGRHMTRVTPAMTSATHRNPLTTVSSLLPRESLSSSSLSSSSSLLFNFRLPMNETHVNELSSLSLLSLNDTKSSEELQMSNNEAAPNETDIVIEEEEEEQQQQQSAVAATMLRVKGSEQHMHNTNSLLTVDHSNATIVASRMSSSSENDENTKNFISTAESSSSSLSTSSASMSTHQQMQQQQHQHQHHHNNNNNNNSNLTATGRNKNHYTNSNNNSSSSSTADVITGERNESLATAQSQNKVNSTGTTRISARRVEHKYILPKSHKTDAPMLNYIFDTFSSANKHHHHDQRYGPHFEDVQLVGKPTNLTVQAGSSIHLNCRISLLQDKTVSWVRRNSEGEDALDLLTVGLHAYTGDKRYKMEFQYPNNWRLKISNVKKDDEATYECQISTHPPRVIQINLHVNAPKVMIVDEFGDPLQEKYYEQDSTLQLSCVVRNVAMSSSVVFWKHSEDVLNYDVTRGGISVKTELMDDGANSTLFIAKINKADSGNYTCSISEYQNYTIVVHILNGESFAELHHGNAICWHRQNHQTWAINLIVLATILLILPAYINR